MPAAIAIPAIISAAGSVASAVTQHKAANKAEKAQVNAANQARDLQGTVYQQQRADLRPYRATGNAALSQLSSLLGVKPQDTPLVPGMASAVGAPMTAQPGIPQSQMRAPMGGMTQLRGPDGSVKAVPNDQVDHFLARGAQRVQ